MAAARRSGVSELFQILMRSQRTVVSWFHVLAVSFVPDQLTASHEVTGAHTDIPSLITDHISTANDTAAAILAPRTISLQTAKPMAAWRHDRPGCVCVCVFECVCVEHRGLKAERVLKTAGVFIRTLPCIVSVASELF